MDLKDLFDAIVQLGQQAKTPVVVALPEPAHVYMIANPDGSWSLQEADPPPRDHAAYDLETVARWAVANPATPASLWYSREGVTLLLDDETRRDRVAMGLDYTPQLDAVVELQKQAKFDQKAFVRLLRITLAGCLDSPTLLQSVRTVKFSLLKGLEGEVQHGKESVGKSLLAELKGANSVPEGVELRVPIWEGQPHVEAVRCFVEVDPIEEKFQLIPAPGAVEAAVNRAEAKLGERLRELVAGDGDFAGRISYGTP